MIEKSTDEKPHTFEEAAQWLAQDAENYIDYEVKLGRHSGALMTRETWLESVADHSFIDYDGMGNEVDENGNVLGESSAVFDEHRILIQEGKHGWIYPSTADTIRPETKYILWYNR
jgi:hypothetical protein